MAVSNNNYEQEIGELKARFLTLAGMVGQSPLHPTEGGREPITVLEICNIFEGCPYFGPSSLGGRTSEYLKALREHRSDPVDDSELIMDLFLDSWNRAEHMARAYLECLKFFDLDMTRKEFKTFLLKLLSYALTGKMEKYLKWECAYILARCLKSIDEPPKPDIGIMWCHTPGALFSGGIGRKVFLRCCLRGRPRDVSFALSLYRVKEASLPVSEIFIQETLQEHVELLTQERDDDDNTEIDRLCVQVRRRVEELRRYAYGQGWKCRPQSPLPSLSACESRSGRKGGAFSELLDSVAIPTVPLSFPTLMGYVRHNTVVKPIYSTAHPDDVDECLNGRNPVDRIPVRRIAIPEPFKVRVVSAGDALLYNHARKYQKALWSMLQCHPACRLVGTPFTENDVDDVCRWYREVYPKKFWDELPISIGTAQMISGDYKSATDNLHPALALSAVDAFADLEGLSLEDRLLLHRALTGHTIVEDGKRIEQSWGQLMGSPVSFPILCIVNLAVTLDVMERQLNCSIDLSEGECPAKVNGDDILFPLPLSGYQSWCDTVTLAGLTPSVGKNYTSREYCMINSKMFRLPWDWDIPDSYVQLPRMGPMLVPQLNLGLVRGGSAVLRGDLLSALRKKPVPWSCGQISDSIREAVEGWEEAMSQRIISTALRYLRPVLDDLPDVSWFVSRDKGGLGIPCYSPERIRTHHLRLASWLNCLQDDARREQYRLGFCRKGTPQFSSSAVEAEFRLLDSLQVKWERKDREQIQENPIRSRIEGVLMRSSVWEGAVALEEFSYAEYRRNYCNAYRRWVRKAEAASCRLKPMKPENALVPDDRIWVCGQLSC